MAEKRREKIELTPELLECVFLDLKKSLNEKKILEAKVENSEKGHITPKLYLFACYTVYGEILDEGQVIANSEEEAEAMVRMAVRLELSNVVEVTEVESSYGYNGVYNLGDY